MVAVNVFVAVPDSIDTDDPSVKEDAAPAVATSRPTNGVDPATAAHRGNMEVTMDGSGIEMGLERRSGACMPMLNLHEAKTHADTHFAISMTMSDQAYT
jgi:hypothetical protein